MNCRTVQVTINLVAFNAFLHLDCIILARQRFLRFLFFSFIKFLLDSIRKWAERDNVEYALMAVKATKTKGEAKVIGYIIELDPPNIQPHACMHSQTRYTLSVTVKLYTRVYIQNWIYIMDFEFVMCEIFPIHYVPYSFFVSLFFPDFCGGGNYRTGDELAKKIGIEIHCLMVMGYGCDLVDHEKKHYNIFLLPLVAIFEQKMLWS